MSAAQTPEKTDRDTMSTHDQDTNSEISSSTTASPSQESEVAFSMASPASTAIITPGPTPSNTGLYFGPSDSFVDTGSRPETPTPGQRSSSGPTAEPKTATDALTDILGQFADEGPDVLGSITKRFKSVKHKKWPLLQAIENKFTTTDYVEGRIYVWTHQKNERLVKIGFTRKDSDARHKKSGNCYAKHTKQQWQSSEPFIGVYRVESIVRKYLSEKNIELVSCVDCGKGHREWFEMDWEKAVEVVNEWTQFVTVAYVGGRLSEQGKEILNAICIPMSEKFEAASEAASSTEIGSVPVEELTVVSEGSEVGQQTIILEEQVGVLAGHEQVCANLNAASDPPSTGQDSSDTILDQDANLPPAEDAPVKGGFRSSTRRVVKKAVLDFKTRLSHSRHSDVSEQADGEGRDGGRGYDNDNSELFLKLFRRFYSTELEEAKKKPNRDPTEPADARDGAQFKLKGMLAWLPKSRSRSTVA